MYHFGSDAEGPAPLLKTEVVAQLDRASDCGSEGRTFESCQPQCYEGRRGEGGNLRLLGGRQRPQGQA